MFGRSKNKTSPETPAASQRENLVQEIEVHAMPQKFRRLRAPVNRTTHLVGLSIMAIALLGMIGGGALLFRSIFKKNRPPVATNINIPAVATNQNINQDINKATENANKNININENLNVNTNTNLNINTNTNINVNANTNINTNANLNVNMGVKLSKGADEDNDKLSDEEEKLYKTQTPKPDSDADGYLDGEEIINLYSPLGKEKLMETDLVKEYTNSTFGYSILYPTSWEMKALDSSGREVMFSRDGEFIEVIIQDNKEKFEVIDWYLKQWPGIDKTQLETVENQGLEGIKSLDGLTIYLAPQNQANEFIYVITYNVGTQTILNFESTFLMMMHSFKLIGET